VLSSHCACFHGTKPSVQNSFACSGTQCSCDARTRAVAPIIERAYNRASTKNRPRSMTHAPLPPETLPNAASQLSAARVTLKPRKARPFFGRHPWVLNSAAARVEPLPGHRAVVDLVSDAGKFIARGLFNSRSRIRVRLYSWDIGQPLDR